MADTFAWCALPNAAGAITLRARVAQFGDGYSQAVGDGINGKVQSWPLTFRGPSTMTNAVTAFLDAHAGYISFLWTPPGQLAAILVRASAYTVEAMGLDNFTVSVTFQQVFQP